MAEMSERQYQEIVRQVKYRLVSDFTDELSGLSTQMRTQFTMDTIMDITTKLATSRVDFQQELVQMRSQMSGELNQAIVRAGGSLEGVIDRYLQARVPVEHRVVAVAQDGTETTSEMPAGMVVPQYDPNYLLSGDTIKQVEAVMRMADRGEYCLLLVTGTQGTGKTSLAQQIAAKRNSLFGLINFGAMQEAREVIGSDQYSPDRGTWFRPGRFPCYTGIANSVVCGDEFNRVENSKVHGALFDWLQRGSFTADSGETFRIAPGVILVMTINEGYEFAGADELDKALRSRFFQIHLSTPSTEQAAKVVASKEGMPEEDVVRLCHLLGANGTLPSWMEMRSLLKTAHAVQAGLSWRLAVAMSFSTLEEGKRNDMLAALQTKLEDNVDTEFRTW